jgi:hypothetical protein
MYDAAPTVKAGNRMCHPMTQANWIRERRSGSSVIELTLPVSANILQIHSQASAIVWLLGIHGNTLRARRVPLARQINLGQFTFDNIGRGSKSSRAPYT